jgi:hypothetical protein
MLLIPIDSLPGVRPYHASSPMQPGQKLVVHDPQRPMARRVPDAPLREYARRCDRHGPRAPWSRTVIPPLIARSRRPPASPGTHSRRAPRTPDASDMQRSCMSWALTSCSVGGSPASPGAEWLPRHQGHSRHKREAPGVAPGASAATAQRGPCGGDDPLDVARPT